MKLGDIITIHGRYKRRTFMQWLRQEPREPMKFRVIAESSGGAYFEYKEESA